MRAYVVTSGIIFALLTVAHLVRMVMENHQLAREPEYLVITALAAALSVWAFTTLRRPR